MHRTSYCHHLRFSNCGSKPDSEGSGLYNFCALCRNYTVDAKTKAYNKAVTWSIFTPKKKGLPTNTEAPFFISLSFNLWINRRSRLQFIHLRVLPVKHEQFIV